MGDKTVSCQIPVRDMTTSRSIQLVKITKERQESTG